MTDTTDPTATDPTPPTYSDDALLAHGDALVAHEDAAGASDNMQAALARMDADDAQRLDAIAALRDNTAAIRAHAAVADAPLPDAHVLLHLLADQASGTRTPAAAVKRALDLLAAYKAAVLALAKPAGTV